MKEYKIRLIKEEKELKVKFTALKKFIATDPMYKELGIKQRNLLNQQRNIMRDYLLILDERLGMLQ